MLSRSVNTVFIAFVTIALAFVSGCKEDKPPLPEKKKATVEFLLSHSWDSDSLRDTSWYTSASGNIIKVEFLAYRIAKLTLHKSDGSFYEADNYEFIDAYDPLRRSFKIKGIPAGDYTGISFLLGVDSARNHSGAQDGALDPSNGLYWGWNTGYIFSMLEGRWVNGADTSALSYHIGLDQFLLKHQKISMMPLSIAETDRKVYLNMNAAEVFKGPNTLVLGTDGAFTHSTDHPELAEKVKDNYKDCIQFIKFE